MIIYWLNRAYTVAMAQQLGLSWDDVETAAAVAPRHSITLCHYHVQGRRALPLLVSRLLVRVFARNVHLSTVRRGQRITLWRESLLAKSTHQLSCLADLFEIDFRIVSHDFLDIDHVVI